MTDATGDTRRGPKGSHGTEAEVEQQLEDLATAHEEIAWEDVPGISTTEAATWTQRVEEAREEVHDNRLLADGKGAQRRVCFAELEELVRARWKDEDYDMDNVGEWAETQSSYEIDRLTPELVNFTAAADVGGLLLEDHKFDERVVNVFYGHSGVNFTIEAEGEGMISAGARAEFSPDEAKEVAAAIFQAAEELSQWQEAEGSSDD